MEDPRAQTGVAYTVPSLCLTAARYRNGVVVSSHAPLTCWRREVQALQQHRDPAWASALPWASARHKAGMQPLACICLLPGGRRSQNTACPQTCRQHLAGEHESVTPLPQWCSSPTWCGATGNTKRYRVENEDGKTMLLEGNDMETDLYILMIA